MHKVVRFGNFEVDLEAGELRKGGLRLRVQDQPFQVLAALLERPGEVVTREELVARLWPDGTFVDFDRGLNAAIARLRQVLSDSAENPRYVETVSRKGYRFIASTADQRAEPVIEHFVFGRSRLGLGSLAAILLMTGSWVLYRTQFTPVSPLRAMPLTAEPGDELCPSLSPDGNQVAFEWLRGTDDPHIYVKVVGRGDSVRLTSQPGAEYGPAWSPDGTQIAFIRKLDSLRIAVVVIPARGGVERQLAEFVYLQHYAWRATHRWLDWTPDGKHLVASGAVEKDGIQSLYLIPLDGGARRRLTTPPQGIVVGDRSPAVSPDGKVVAFARASAHMYSELYLQEVSKDFVPVGEPRQLTSFGGNADAPAWMPNGREIVYTLAGPGARPGLWRIRAGGDSKPRRMDMLGREGLFPSFGPNGRLVISHSVTRDFNIWRLEIPVGKAAVRPAVRLIESSLVEANPQYSPDGARIAFDSDRSGNAGVWICAQDGTHCFEWERHPGETIGTPRWSPDGRQIAFDALVGAQRYDVYVRDVEGGGPRRRLTDHPMTDSIPSWSADGKWVYFRSDRTNREEIWKVPSAGGKAIQVTHNGGHVVFESPDGSSLFYTKSQTGSALWQSALDGGKERKVYDAVESRAFAVAADRVYLMRPTENGPASLVCLFRATGKASEVLQMPLPLAYGLSLSPDGRFLLYSQIDYFNSDLVLFDNVR